MKKLLAALLVFCCTALPALAQTSITLPIAANAVADLGNGPIKARVVAGNASIFTSQSSGLGSTSGSSTTLTLTTTPATAPLVGGLISGAGITSGTTITAYNGTTGVTLSAAMTVSASTPVAWGAACPSTPPSNVIRASVSAGYYIMYTQARVCAVSPGGPVNTLLIEPVFLEAGGTGALLAVNNLSDVASVATARNNIFPTPTQAGDVAYWNGSTWVTLAGNSSGTQFFSENSSGVPSWASGTVGGSSSDVLFNSGGAATGDSGFTYAGVGGAITQTNGSNFIRWTAGTTPELEMFFAGQTDFTIIPGNTGSVTFGISNQAIFSGGIYASGSGAGNPGIGYLAGTGTGGTVTQATNKSTAVTLNKPTGQITMNNAALGAGTIVSFTFTNAVIGSADTLILNHISGGTVGSYGLNAQAAAGSATINVRNNSGGSLSEAVVIQYNIIKGAIN